MIDTVAYSSRGMDLAVYKIPSTPMQIVNTKSKSLPGVYISLLFYF